MTTRQVPALRPMSTRPRHPRTVAIVRSPGFILAGILVLTSIPAAAVANPADRNGGGTVYVNCWHQAPGPTFSAYFVARAHPRACTIWGSPEDLANENVLRHLQGRSWGRATTM